MTNFTDQVEIREQTIAGKEVPFHWARGDMGAWDGPWRDWLESHSQKYFTHVQNKGTVITAGANMGIHCYFYASLFTHVYAFEPSPLNFYCLNLNTPFDNVYKMQMAVGERDAFCGLDTSAHFNTGTHTISTERMWPAVYPMVRLDSLNFPACDLLQMDIEGYEYKALLGASRLIMTHRPVVIVERNSTAQESEQLLSNGFQYVKIEESVSDSIWIPAERG